MVAIVALAVTVALGLAMSGRLARRPGLPAKLKRHHEATTLVTLALIVAHAGALSPTATCAPASPAPCRSRAATAPPGPGSASSPAGSRSSSASASTPAGGSARRPGAGSTASRSPSTCWRSHMRSAPAPTAVQRGCSPCRPSSPRRPYSSPRCGSSRAREGANRAPERARAFHRLRVARVTRLTEDSVLIDFDLPPQPAKRFEFKPGQRLTARAQLDGREEPERGAVGVVGPRPDRLLRDAGNAILRVRLPDAVPVSGAAVKEPSRVLRFS